MATGRAKSVCVSYADAISILAALDHQASAASVSDWNAHMDAIKPAIDALQSKRIAAAPVSEQIAKLRDEMRENAKTHRADNWCNTDDKLIWKAIHREVAETLDNCANRLDTILSVRERGTK